MVAGTVILHQGDPRRYKPWPLTSTFIPCDTSTGPLTLRSDVTVHRVDPLYMAHWHLTLSTSEDHFQLPEHLGRPTRTTLFSLSELSNNISPNRGSRERYIISGHSSSKEKEINPRKKNIKPIAGAYTKFISRWNHLGKENRAPNNFQNMMTSLFALNQGSLQKKQPNGSEQIFSHSKSFDEEALNRSSPIISEQGSQTNTSETKVSEINSSIGGTKPKTPRFRRYSGIRRGSSSDDSVFLPQKVKVRYKTTNTSDSERETRSSRKHLSTLPSSTESDESTIEVRQGKILGSHKMRYSGSKKVVAANSKSSISSRSRPCSKSRTQRNRSGQPRSRSHSGSRVSFPSHTRTPSNSAQQLSEDMPPCEYSSDRVRNQSQNTEIMGLNKSYSTIENEAFLRRVEEVLSEIVEQKKQKIFQHEKDTRTLLTSRPPHHSLDISKKDYRRPVGRWLISKHYDVSEQKKSSFSHIITSHGDGKLRRRSKSSDLLETHKNCFTKLQPYKPRILRSDFDCRLLDNKNKQATKQKKESRINVKPKPKKSPVSQPELVSDFKPDETPRTDDQKSSTIEEILPTNTSNNNTEADDTCYESEHAGSDCALDTTNNKDGPPHSSRQTITDQAEASVDSAYTGSRGPTPDDQADIRIKTLKHKLHHREKHLEHKNKLFQEGGSGSESISAHVDGKLSVDEAIVEKIRREIICEIRDIGIYSDFAINTLLDLYRRKYNHVSRKDMDCVTHQIRSKFGLKKGKVTIMQEETTPISAPQAKSPKKSKVKFVAVESDTSDGPMQLNKNEGMNDHENLVLPNEARLLQEVLRKSRNDNDTVRWLSQDEIKEAKWASQILKECGIADEMSKILDSATTWEEVSKALGVDSPFFRTIECGHEESFEDQNPPSFLLDCCTSPSPDMTVVTGQDMKNLRLPEGDIRASVDDISLNDNKCQARTAERSSLRGFKTSIEGNLDPQFGTTARRGLPIGTVPNGATCIADDRNEENESSKQNSKSLTNEMGIIENNHLPISNESSVATNETCALVSWNEVVTNDDTQNLNVETQKQLTELSTAKIVDDHSVHISPVQTECLEEDDDFFDQTLVSDPNSSVSDPNKLQIEKLDRPIKDLKEPQLVSASEISADKHCRENNEDNLPLQLTEENHVNKFVDVEDGSSNKLVGRTTTEVSSLKDQENFVRDSDYSDNGIQQTSCSINISNQEESHDEPGDLISPDSPLHPSPLKKFDELYTKDKSSFNGNSFTMKRSRDIPNNSTVNQSPSFSRRLKLGISSAPSLSITSASAPSALHPASASSSKTFPRAASSTQPAVSPTQPAISPTQPSLKGKIAALAAAYSSRADDTPDWLLVADEVCKQFNISL